MSDFFPDKPPNWVVSSSNITATLTGIILWSLIPGVIFGVFINWLSSHNKVPSYLIGLASFLNIIFQWCLYNPLIVLLFIFIIWLLHRIAKLYKILEVPFTEKQLRTEYLNDVIKETTMHIIEGISNERTQFDVKLEDVFIKLRFRANQMKPTTDYLPSTADWNGENQLSDRNSQYVRNQMRSSWVYEDEGKLISIEKIWQTLTIDTPVAVILASPGMGKSTLIQAFKLHMACLCQYQSVYSAIMHFFRPSKQPLLPISLPLMPIYVGLGDYANKRAESDKDNKITLCEYITQLWEHHKIGNFLIKSLERGGCLLLFDGLDDVTREREDVIREVKNFIRNYSVGKDPNFNRFLITSRIAGYNSNYFPGYLNYTITDLNDEQVDKCLASWQRCDVNKHPAHRSKNKIDDKVAKELNHLGELIKKDQKIHDLAGKPLLLVFMILLQLREIEPQKWRIKLYRDITNMLLEKHKDEHGNPLLSEEKAIEYLGPLAMWMQEQGKRWCHIDEVKDKLQLAFVGVGDTDEEVDRKIESFLTLARIEGGLIGYCAEDFLEFAHRTFQEYIIARYFVREIMHDSSSGIANLVNKARNLNDVWREPFLLAVAYLSFENKVLRGRSIARNIISNLIDVDMSATIEEKVHNLCLAVCCMSEVDPMTIENTMEESTVQQLSVLYEKARLDNNPTICQQIQDVCSLAMESTGFHLKNSKSLFAEILGLQ